MNTQNSARGASHTKRPYQSRGRGRGTFRNQSLVLNSDNRGSLVGNTSQFSLNLFNGNQNVSMETVMQDIPMETEEKSRIVTFNGPTTSKEDRQARFLAKPEANRYEQLKAQREQLRQMYISQGKIADSSASTHLSQAVAFKGECLDMCPEYERHERELQMGLDPLEKIPGTDSVDHARAVKRFRRSAAGDEEALPSDVRPPHILVKTLDYLVNDILAEHGLEKSYAFVRDRARAIRKDFFLQNYRGIEAVDCHERIARYHILCSHVLCENPSVSLQQEHEQMRKTLQSLREYYADSERHGIKCPNEPEFQAYYLLSHLFQNEFISRAEQLRSEVFKHPLVQLAVQFHHLAQRNNEHARGHPRTEGSINAFVRLFRALRDPSVPYLFSCVLHLSFVSIRKGGLKTLQKTYYCFPDQHQFIFPIEQIVDWFGFNDIPEALENLDYYEIPHANIDGRVVAYIGKMKEVTRMRNGKFKEDQRASLQPKLSTILERKRAGVSDVSIINGVIGNTANLASGNDVRPTISVPTTFIQQPSPMHMNPQATPFTLLTSKPTHPTSFINESAPRPVITPVFPVTSDTVWQQSQTVIATPKKPIFADADIIQIFYEIFLSHEVNLIAFSAHKELMAEYNQRQELVRRRQEEENERRRQLLEYQRQLEIEKRREIQNQVERRNAIISAAAQHFSDVFVEEVVTDIVWQEIVMIVEVELLNLVYKQIASEICQECVEGILTGILKKVSADLKVSSSVQKKYFQKWKRRMQLEQLYKHERRMRALKFIENAASMQLAPPQTPQKQIKKPNVHRTNIFGKTVPIETPVISDEQLSVTLPVENDIRPFDLHDIISPHLNQETDALYFKLVICPLDSSLVISEFLNDWIFKKLGVSTNQSVVYTENVFVKNVVKESNLVLQIFDPKQRENVSGPTAAIFFFSLFEELSEVYFTGELQRLQEFMGCLPPYAKIPVVFGVFTTLSITVEMFLEKLSSHLNIQELVEKSQFHSISVLDINIADENMIFSFDRQKSEQNLKSQMEWLAEQSSPPPNIGKSISKDFLLDIRKYQDAAIQKIRSIPIESVKEHILAFNGIIHLFNLEISSIGQLISNNVLMGVSWPPQELVEKVGIPVDWNASEIVMERMTKLEQINLPHLREVNIRQEIETAYHELCIGLSDMPFVTEQAVNSICETIKYYLDDYDDDFSYLLIQTSTVFLSLGRDILQTELSRRQYYYLSEQISIVRDSYIQGCHSLIGKFKRRSIEKAVSPGYQYTPLALRKTQKRTVGNETPLNKKTRKMDDGQTSIAKDLSELEKVMQEARKVAQESARVFQKAV